MNNISYVIIACYPDKGMKSYGSKSLLEFSKKKLLQHQIEVIKSVNHNNSYEIIVISDFETCKLQKVFSNQAQITCLQNQNPVFLGCKLAKYDHVVFIDYGCLFNKNILKNLTKDAYVATTNNQNNKLDIGCIIDKNIVKHMFFDLPENKFCNIFSITSEYKNIILRNSDLDYFNLLAFEIINIVIDLGGKFKIHNIDNNRDFLFFNHMRQKHAVSKFIKNSSN